MMKTRILFTVVLALALSSTSFANLKKRPTPLNQQVDVQLTAENQIVVRYLSDTPDKVKVLVFDERGKALSKKTFVNEKHSKLTYDLNKLKSDELQFKVLANNRTVCFETVSVNQMGVVSVPVPDSTIHKSIGLQEPLLTEQHK